MDKSKNNSSNNSKKGNNISTELIISLKIADWVANELRQITKLLAQGKTQKAIINLESMTAQLSAFLSEATQL